MPACLQTYWASCSSLGKATLTTVLIGGLFGVTGNLVVQDLTLAKGKWPTEVPHDHKKYSPLYYILQHYFIIFTICIICNRHSGWQVGVGATICEVAASDVAVSEIMLHPHPSVS